MNYFVYDVESSGLTKKDEVIQFSGILTNDDFSINSVYNFYCDTAVKIHPDAYALHHLSTKLLSTLSEGKTFEDNFLKLPFLHNKNLTWVGYNNWSCDERLINQTLTNNGLPAVNFGRRIEGIKDEEGVFTLDLMRSISNFCNRGIKMKLIDAVHSIDKYSQDQLDAIYDKYFRTFDSVNTEDVTFHNSLYDAFITWVALNYYGPRIMI